MLVVRSLVRSLSLVLLLLAAGDLSYPSGCDDGDMAPGSVATICAGDHDAPPGHAGDDCFCCSRTVCAEVEASAPQPNLVTLAFAAPPVSLVHAFIPPPSQPPQV